MHYAFFGHKVLYISALACALIELDKNNVKSGYPQIVKDFSQQVRFYSTAAYEVVRKHFVLPSSATHQRWNQPADVSPSCVSRYAQIIFGHKQNFCQITLNEIKYSCAYYISKLSHLVCCTDNSQQIRLIVR